MPSTKADASVTRRRWRDRVIGVDELLESCDSALDGYADAEFATCS